MTKLRGKVHEQKNLRLDGVPQTFLLPRTNTFELAADLDLNTADRITLQFTSGSTNSRPTVITFTANEFKAFEAKTELALTGKAKALNLRIFVDRSVVEVFANDTACATKVISPLEPNATLEIQAEGTGAKAKRVQIWPLKSIW